MRQLYALSPDEAAFLLEAVGHFCATRCPLRGGEGACPLLAWRESAHTGAIESVCKRPPGAWNERLGGQAAIRPLGTAAQARA
jgi:hypothetical protein